MDKMVVVRLAIVLCAGILTYNSVDASGPYSVTVRPSLSVKKQSKYISMLPTTTDNKNIEIDINWNFYFFVIQAHTQRNNISLSSSSSFSAQNTVLGTNIGLVQFNNSNSFNFYFKDFDLDTDILFVVIPYGRNDPIPGGCNMELDVENAPYQLLHYTYNYITVDVQKAKVMSKVCEADIVKLEMYHMFFTPSDFTTDTYFQEVQKMLTVEDIKKYGTKVSDPISPPYLRWYFSNYEGIASTYAVVATWRNYQSAYIPTVTYGCNIKDGATSCYQYPVNWYLMGVLIFLTGFCSLFIHDYYWICHANYLIFIVQLLMVIYHTLPLYACILIGIACFIIWPCIMGNCGDSPQHYSNIAFASYFLTCLIFFNSAIGDISIFQKGYNYWIVFLIVLLVINTILKLTYLTYLIIGVIYIPIGLSTFYRGIFYYAILNNIRHMIDSNYESAIVDPPVLIGGPHKVTIRSSSNIEKEDKYMYMLNTTAETQNITIEINPDFYFFILQVHSYINKIHLSSSALFAPENSTYGTEIGLVQFKSNESYEFFFKNYYNDTDLFFLVTLYDKNDPIPGICMKESEPYQVLVYNYNYITITVQEANVFDKVCKDDSVEYQMYRMFFTPYDFSTDTYLQGIEKMSTVEGIKTYGTKVSHSLNSSDLIWYFSNYRGIGSVYAVVATWKNHQFAYVPAVTYGCDITNGTASCYQFLINSFDWYLMGSLIFFVGLISLIAVDYEAIVALNILMLVVQVLIVTYYCVPLLALFIIIFILSKCECPDLIFSKILIVTNPIITSYFMTCILFYIWQIDDISSNDILYWIIFLVLSVTISFILKLAGLTYLIMALLYISIGVSTFYGGLLYYAILNNIRHIIDYDFALAIIEPPFIIADVITISAIAIILAAPLLVQFLVILCKGFVAEDPPAMSRLLQMAVGYLHCDEDKSMTWLRILIRQWKNIRSNYNIIQD